MATLNLATILRLSAGRRPDHPAVIVGESITSYHALHEAARRLAGGLAALGVRRGQHVALLFPNVAEFTVAYYACHYAGCPAVPLNVMFTAEELAYHLDDAAVVAVIVAGGLVEAATDAAERVETCRHLIVSVPRDRDVRLPPGSHVLEDLVASARPVAELPDTSPDDTAVILYTSGTTGRPKGAELSHFNLVWNGDHMGRHYFPAGDPVTLGALPLFHSFGQTVIQNATLARGGTMVLLPRFDPLAALEAIDRHRVNLFAGVPTMYFGLLRHPEAGRFHLRSLERCISGGAPMPVEVMREFDARYRVDILEGYGLSETSPVASQNRPDRPKKPGSIGLPLEGVEFKLIGDHGETITEPGVRGEICIKGPNIMSGYFRRPEATAEAIRDGWFRTGDVAHRDEDGFYFIVDRKKDMLIRGGYNVYPREVEEVLYGHPAVAEAAVVGVPDERLGEEVAAVVALKRQARVTVPELIGYCRDHLAPFKCPRVVAFVESLPRGPTGKILKRTLRDDLASGRLIAESGTASNENG